MKIINEIEKSRLNEENMHQINGGDNSCNPYLSCQPKYTVTPCALYNHCPEVTICGEKLRTCSNYDWIWKL